MPKSVAIVQSNYIPWKGYFDLINQVDELILFDDMQYTRRDWRNRNKIKTQHGLQWLTIPVDSKGKYFQKINETQISQPNWWQEHWKTIRHNYVKAPFFDQYAPIIESLYQTVGGEIYLSQINYTFLKGICELLGCTTKLSWSSDYDLIEGKTERLVHLCQQANAEVYLSGRAAESYIDEALFKAADIHLEYMDYGGYPDYPQLYPPFEHGVSIIDLIFCTGAEAASYVYKTS